MKPTQKDEQSTRDNGVVAWSAQGVRNITLQATNVRMYADAPYAKDLFTEATWQRLVHPQQLALNELSPPLILSKGHKRYYLPGNPDDLILHTSCVMSLCPALIRYLDTDTDTSDFGPSLSSLLKQESFKPRSPWGRYWARVESRTQELISAGYSHMLLADIERCAENVDVQRLSGILREAKCDEYAVLLLEQMHTFWQSYGCRGLPLTGGFAVLIKPYLKTIDTSLRDKGLTFIRIQDDFRIFCRSREEALAAQALLETAAKKLGFSLNQAKTSIHVANQPRSALKKWRSGLQRTLSKGVFRPLLSDALQSDVLRPGALWLLRLLYRHRWKTTYVCR